MPTVSPDLYFPLEITTREYAGHVLLGTEMAARGRTVVIGHKGPVTRIARAAQRRGVVFYKNSTMPPDLARTRHELVGMDPEAGIVYRDFSDFLQRRAVVRRDSPNRAQFCFGPDDHDVLISKFPDLRHRIHLTGSPRVELWGPSGTDFYAVAMRQIRERYGDFALFTSSGGFGHEKVLGWRGADPKTTWERAEHAHHFFRMAEAAVKAGLNVVVRPHPADSWVAWQSVVSNAPRMHIDSTFDLTAWARVAQVVVHPGKSTAAVEAVCAGTPTISTQSSLVTNVATDLSHLASDADHLAQLITEAEDGRLQTFPTPDAQMLLSRKLLQPLEGATLRVADVLDSTLPCEGPTGVRFRKERLRGRLMRLLSRQQPRRMLGDQRPRPFKRDPLLLESVEQDVMASLTILNRKDDLRVRQLTENCFALSP